MTRVKELSAGGKKAIAGIASVATDVADAAGGLGKAAIGLVARGKASPGVGEENGADKTPEETEDQMAQRSDTKSTATAKGRKTAARGKTAATASKAAPKGSDAAAKGRAKAQKPMVRPTPRKRRPPRRTGVKVAVLGADAAGGSIGLHLSNSGVDTTLIARGPHLAAMQKNGITVRTKKGELNARPFCTKDAAEAGVQDYVIVALKSQAGPDAAARIAPLLGPGTTVVTAQAGLPWWYFYRSGGEFDGSRLESVDSGGELWAQVGPERAVGCVVQIAAEFEEPGVIRHHSGNSIVLGEPSGEKTKRAEALSGLLTEAGFKPTLTASIRNEIWNDLWGRLAFDPISVLTSTASAKIGDDPSVRAIAKAMIVEAQQVGEALGVKFDGNAQKKLKAAADGDGPPPMLQDMNAGRRLEIDALGTAVQELAQRAGVATPATDMVLALVRLRAKEAGVYTPPPKDGALGKALAVAGEGAKAAASKTIEAGAQVAGGVTMAAGKVAGFTVDVAGEIGEGVTWAYDKAVPLGKGTAKAATRAVTFVHETSQAVLATQLAGNLNSMLGDLAKGAPTIYDKMMDAEYIRTGVGGGLHRIFDGGHTLWGAFKAARDAPTDDGIVARAMGMMLGLFRDVTTPAGLPFFTWDIDTYKKVASYLKETFGIPKRVFADLVTYDATDIISGLLGSATLVFRWSDGEAKDFARIVAGTGLTAVVKRNPILGVVTLAAMAKAFMEARKTGSYKACVKEMAEGVAATAAPMAVVSLVVAAGGPASVALIASILAGMAVTILAKKVDDAELVEALAARVAQLTSTAAEEVGERLASITARKEVPMLPA